MTSRIYESTVGIRHFYGLTVLLAIAGCVALWRRGRRDMVVIIVAPYLLALIASLARLYPFSPGRVSLYLIPGLVIMFTAGIDLLARLRPRMRNVVRVVLFLVFVLPQAFVLKWSSPPWLVEDVPSALAHLKANRQPGDKIYSYWAALPATLFYAPKYGIKDNEISAGQLHGDTLSAYVADLDSLRDTRLWLLFSHDQNDDQRDAILSRMDSIGHRLDKYPAQPARPDAAVYLYDVTASPALKNEIKER